MLFADSSISHLSRKHHYTMYKSTECPKTITRQAPLLFLPNIFDADFCRQLIHIWETGAKEDSPILIEENGKWVKGSDYKQAIRQNHCLQEGEIQDHIRHFIRDRVRPEIKKAFHFEVTRFEGFNIFCYDAITGGYVRPHRDDATEGTAYRRFSMTINLNVGEYEGGCLRFPEYGSDLYQPETGGAVIFSGSLLHEVTDVTKGRRFALVSFFYGEREAQLIEEYNRRVRELERQSQGKPQLQKQR
jgi:predicted 2-oxoglutarate/Fe(II)-dependent dioxygenase YbiX